MFPDGKPAKIALGSDDPRVVFAEWLLRPENPWFSREHRQPRLGLADGPRHRHEPDDIRPDNPPSNPALLEFLQKRVRHLPLRHEASLPRHPELEDLSVVLDSGARHDGGRRQFRALSAAAHGGGGADRCAESDHRHKGIVQQPDPGALHLHPGKCARRCSLPTAASPARFSNCSDARRATRAMSPSAIATPAPPAPASAELDACASEDQDVPAGGRAHDGEAKPRELTAKIYLTLLSRPPTEQELAAVEAHAKSSATPARRISRRTSSGR